MSSLSNQPPGSPFSEYSELCKVPSVAPATQAWDWQHGDMGPPRSFGGATGLTDEDKLCFFDPPAGGGMDADRKVPGRGGFPGLDSAGESPESPVSSSPSPMGYGNNGVLLPPVPGSPARRMDIPSPSSSLKPGPDSTGAWNPETLPPQNTGVTNYCVIGVVNDNYLEREDEDSMSALGGRQMAEGSSEENEEEEEEVKLAPCFMGRAEQQRKAMRRTMSECSHLSVPSSLELPDHYPGAGLDELTSSMGAPRRSPHSTMKRSMTVADDQAPPTLSAAGATRSDLRQDQDPTLNLLPFPPMRDCGGTSPLEGIMEGMGADKEQDVLLPVPLSSQALNGTGPGLGMDTNLGTGFGADMSNNSGTGFGAGKSTNLGTGFGESMGTNPFTTLEVR
ncbi:unnamed protein product [Oncorhynchus mykiss]|uniref:Uncharacterized protein n=1 Tax=Oncorhynchus mykiss TaxID=8022 RepID=A0A060YR61_ONCMY|nr:unnamed protein product [Oncorhynchus mykiss]